MGFAALQQPMLLVSLVHGKVALAAKVESARAEERHGLIEGFGCPVGRGCGEGDAQVGCMLIGEGHDPGWTPGERRASVRA